MNEQSKPTIYLDIDVHNDDFDDGPSTARVNLTPEMIERIRALQTLCIDHKLTEAREGTFAFNVSFDPDDETADPPRFTVQELVVTTVDWQLICLPHDLGESATEAVPVAALDELVRQYEARPQSERSTPFVPSDLLQAATEAPRG